VRARVEQKRYQVLRWVPESVAADGRGRVDLERDAPISGTYSGVDSMGLFWSMTSDDPTPTVTRTRDALHVKLRAESDNTTHAMASVQRLVVPDGVRACDVRERGAVARRTFVISHGALLSRARSDAAEARHPTTGVDWRSGSLGDSARGPG
jgi:hypothetical protein